MIDTVRLHGFVTGRVQGVGFRSFVRRSAFEHGINGWVRNCHDGSVEFLAEAERPKLNNFLETVRRGNRFSHVQSVECEWGDAEGITGFEVEY